MPDAANSFSTVSSFNLGLYNYTSYYPITFVIIASMSFGWSAGDILSAIKFAVKVSQALKEGGGASSDFQEISLFFESLGVTLEEPKTHDGQGTNPAHVSVLQVEVAAIRELITSFNHKIIEKDSGRVYLQSRPI